MEITIYGGFNTVTSLIQQIALFFSDSWIPGIMIAMFCLGILSVGIMEIMGDIKGGKSTLMSGFILCIIGLGLVKALILNTGPLMIYDRTSNQHAVVNNIPNAIRVTYKIFNMLENIFVERWYTASHHPALDYRDNANGIGFDIFLNASKVGGITNDPLIMRSLGEYYTNCIIPALHIPGFNLTLEELKHGNAPGGLLASYGKAQNNIRQTRHWQSGTHQGGTRMSCRDSWQLIRAYITNPANFSRSRTKMCSASGFDTSDPAQLQACEQKLGHHLQFMSNGQFNEGTGHFYTLMGLARATFEVTKVGGDLAINSFIQQDMTVKGIGAMMGSSGYMGEARYAMFAIVGAITCVLILLWPTPAFGKAFSGIFYLWAFIFFWGIGDAIAHKIAVDRAFDLYAELRATGGSIGINTLFHIPNETVRALGVFGQLRAYSMLVATIIASILFKTSGAGMAQLGSRVGSAMSDIGQGAAEKMMTLSGYENTIGSTKMGQAQLMNSLANTGHGHEQYANAAGYKEQMEFGQNLTKGDLANAAAREGLLPDGTPGGPVAGLGAAVQSNTSLGTEHGKTNLAINPETGEVTYMSHEVAGQKNQDGSYSGTYTYTTDNLGAVSANMNEAYQESTRSHYSDMVQQQKAAADNYEHTIRSGNSERENLEHQVRSSNVFSRQDVESIDNLYQQQGKLGTSLTNQITDNSDVSVQDAREISRALTAYTQGSVSLDSSNIPFITAKIEAGLRAEGKSIDKDTITRALSTMEGSNWQEVRDYQETDQTTWKALAQKASTSSDENAVAAGRGFTNSLDEQEAAGKSLSTAVSRTTAAGRVMEEAQTSGGQVTTNLAANIRNDLVERFSNTGADELLRRANAGDTPSQQIITQTSNQTIDRLRDERFRQELSKLRAPVQEQANSNIPERIPTMRDIQAGQEWKGYTVAPTVDPHAPLTAPSHGQTVDDLIPNHELVNANQINNASAGASDDPMAPGQYTAQHSPGAGKEEIEEKEEYMRTRGLHYNNHQKGEVTDEQRNEANSAAPLRGWQHTRQNGGGR